MKKIKIYTLSLLAAAGMTACSNNEFSVSGTIEGASDSTRMVLEVSNNGLWLIADSVIPSNNGSFKVTQPALQHADIYRLRYENKCIYFPIDSIDNIKINSKLNSFSTDYTLSGSQHAIDVMNVDKKAMQMNGTSEADMKAWKVELANTILADPSSIVAYYIINKYIGNTPLYNPQDKDDLKMIGAVANAYYTFKPNDPRTNYLVALTINNRRQISPVKGDTLVAEEVPLIDISLQDEVGKTQTLSEVASKGNVIVLNFTIFSDELSPAFNKMLSDEYQKYHKRGLEIYQIAYDIDEFAWRQAAKNLPWITVYDPGSINSINLPRYNVGAFPAIFIINRKGEIVERVIDFEVLSSSIEKYL